MPQKRAQLLPTRYHFNGFIVLSKGMQSLIWLARVCLDKKGIPTGMYACLPSHGNRLYKSTCFYNPCARESNRIIPSSVGEACLGP